MSVKEHPNEWADIPKETVLEWLDSPCTRLLRKLLGDGLADYDRTIIAAMSLPYSVEEDRLRLAAASFSAGKAALNQVVGLLESAEAHVKA